MGKYLQALKLLYDEGDEFSESLETQTDKTDRRAFVSTVSATSGDIENIQTANEASVSFTDHELAEHKINGLKLHDDRVFVRQKLIGTCGEKRLELVTQYFDEWRKGMEAEPVSYKKDNAGRYRANVWLRQYFNRD